MPAFLIVDQDPRFAAGLRSVLEKEGWPGKTTSDAKQAAQLALDEPPQLLLASTEVDGARVLLERFSMNAGTGCASIAFVTAANASAVSAEELGADAILPRPCTREQFWSTIRRVLSAAQRRASERPATEETKLTSAELFGDLLEEVDGADGANQDRHPPSQARSGPIKVQLGQSPKEQPATPQPAAQQPAPAQRPKASKRSTSGNLDDELERKLEQTLSGVGLGVTKSKKAQPPIEEPIEPPTEQPINQPVAPPVEPPAPPVAPPTKPKRRDVDVDDLLNQTLSGLVDLEAFERRKSTQAPSPPPTPTPPPEVATASPDRAETPESRASSGVTSDISREEAPATVDAAEETPIETAKREGAKLEEARLDEARVEETINVQRAAESGAQPSFSTMKLPKVSEIQAEESEASAPHPMDLEPPGAGSVRHERRPVDEDAFQAALERQVSATDTPQDAGWLDELGGQEDRPTASPDGSDSPLAAAGRRFGSYTLVERIAVGGMAEVWKARMSGAAGFQKIVAIKKILPHLTANLEFEKMFVDEAKLAAQLNHPNITQIYDLGQVRGEYYIAMEYVDGKDLRTILDLAQRHDYPLNAGLALLIASRLASGLDHAHRRRDENHRELGLVHRDVSPQNVLIGYEGDVKLCDFGIVKAVSKASQTQMGALKGKLQYMSPEQAWGKPVDARTDLFSVGALLFEMLTGRRLFIGESELSVLEAVRECRIESPRDLDPTISDEINAVVLRALSKEPEDRYQTAAQLRNELEDLLLQLPDRPGAPELSYYLKHLSAVAEGRQPPPEPAHLAAGLERIPPSAPVVDKTPVGTASEEAEQQQDSGQQQAAAGAAVVAPADAEAPVAPEDEVPDFELPSWDEMPEPGLPEFELVTEDDPPADSAAIVEEEAEKQAPYSAEEDVEAQPLEEPVPEPGLDEPALQEPALEEPVLEEPALDEPLDAATDLSAASEPEDDLPFFDLTNEGQDTDDVEDPVFDSRSFESHPMATGTFGIDELSPDPDVGNEDILPELPDVMDLGPLDDHPSEDLSEDLPEDLAFDASAQEYEDESPVSPLGSESGEALEETSIGLSATASSLQTIPEPSLDTAGSTPTPTESEPATSMEVAESTEDSPLRPVSQLSPYEAKKARKRRFLGIALLLLILAAAAVIYFFLQGSETPPEPAAPETPAEVGASGNGGQLGNGLQATVETGLRDVDGQPGEPLPASEVRPPKLVNIGKAQYPRAGRQAELDGQVVLALLVDPEGKVEQVRVLEQQEASPSLVELALDLAAEADFLPARRAADGDSVRMWTQLRIAFES